MGHLRNIGHRLLQTPQTEAIPGTTQILNHAAGYSWAVDDMTHLRRFLVLNTTGGTYYVGERPLAKENLGVIERLLSAGQGKQVIDTIVEISQAGRAISNDPALFALARCAACDVHGKVQVMVPPERTSILHRAHHPDFFARFPHDGDTLTLHGGKKTFLRVGETIVMTKRRAHASVEEDHPEDIAVRQYAFSHLRQVARTGTHLLHFVSYSKQFRGWGRAYKRNIAAYYHHMDTEKLVYQVLKYQQRDGYHQRDVLRLAHPKATNETQNALYHWVTQGWEGVGPNPHPDPVLRRLWAYEHIKKAPEEKQAASLITDHRLPREAVPAQYAHSIPVWEAILADMPLEALLRNLATMTKEGVLTPLGASTTLVLSRLGNKDLIQKARLHPIKILAALNTYAGGKGIRSNASWQPIQSIVDALHRAFSLSFQTVEPTGKRLLLAIDTSGSMRGTLVNGIPHLQAHTAAGAMALVIAQSEWSTTDAGVSIPNYHIIGVDESVQELFISPRQRLDEVARSLSIAGGGGTDLSLPMLYALKKKMLVDAFVILTDSESYAGIHPRQALEQYRREMNPLAKIINVQMTATRITNNDPHDKYALECIGFDPSVPEAIASFLRGDF